jgi:hypothetical protein
MLGPDATTDDGGPLRALPPYPTHDENSGGLEFVA